MAVRRFLISRDRHVKNPTEQSCHQISTQICPDEWQSSCHFLNMLFECANGSENVPAWVFHHNQSLFNQTETLIRSFWLKWRLHRFNLSVNSPPATTTQICHTHWLYNVRGSQFNQFDPGDTSASSQHLYWLENIPCVVVWKKLFHKSWDWWPKL